MEWFIKIGFAEHVIEIFRKGFPEENNLSYMWDGDILYIMKKNSPKSMLAQGNVTLNKDSPIYTFRGIIDRATISGFVEYKNYRLDIRSTDVNITE